MRITARAQPFTWMPTRRNRVFDRLRDPLAAAAFLALAGVVAMAICGVGR